MKSLIAFLSCLFTSAITMAQYRGGANDGNHLSISPNQNPLPAIYRGGSNDGGDMSIALNQNPLPSIYRGGGNDGYAKETVFNQNPNCPTDTVRWNGNVDFDWHNPANWKCGVLPNVNSTVVIPAGVVRYPRIIQSVEIKKLINETGASLIVNQGVQFKLNGQ